MVSIAGSQMQIWALFWHIRTLTDQPIALGGIGLARILPGDRLLTDRRRGGRRGQPPPGAVCHPDRPGPGRPGPGLADLQRRISTCGTSTCSPPSRRSPLAFDLPARQALVPNLVPARDLPNAFSLTSIAFQTGAIVGPALSGLVIAYCGQSWVYLHQRHLLPGGDPGPGADGPGSAAGRSSAGQRPRSAWRRSARASSSSSSQPIILSTMILDFFATFFSSANTLMPIYARDVLHVGAVAYGWLSAAQSIGAVAAAVIFSQIRAHPPPGSRCSS